MINEQDIDIWIIRGKENNELILLIVHDLEDKDYFPIYFKSIQESNKYKNNIISESKLKVIYEINLSYQ
jgi:hypothetical protein